MKLHSYQEKGLEFALSRLMGGGGAGLFWQPGLGKTLTTLTILEYLRDLDGVERVLLTGPKRVLDCVWPLEVTKFEKDFQVTMHGKRVISDGRLRIDLITRDSLHRVTPAEARRYDMFVADESSSFKSWKSKRGKSAREVAKLVPRRLILTGTPTPNSVKDLGPQMFIVDRGEALGKSEAWFNRSYCQKGGYLGREWRPMYGAEKRIREAISPMVYSLDAESNIDMPDLIVNTVPVPMTPAAERMNKQMKKDLCAELKEAGTAVLAMNAASSYMKLRQIAGGTLIDNDGMRHVVHEEKIKALRDLDEELGEKPLLVFYQFRAELDLLLGWAKSCSVLNGDTTDSGAEIDKWVRGKTRVMLAQAQSCSHGLNLQVGGCRDCVFYSCGDSAEIYDQAFRRVYRQGSKGSVTVHRLKSVRSIDEVILDRVDNKLSDQRKFLAELQRWASVN